MNYPTGFFRPAEVCRTLLAALAASDGRSKKRKRDQTPDSIGLAVKRRLLERVVQEDPDAQSFEAWLLNYSDSNQDAQPSGAVSAMARAVLEEWRLVHSMDDFKSWLDHGAPSADADSDGATRSDSPASHEGKNRAQ